MQHIRLIHNINMVARLSLMTIMLTLALVVQAQEEREYTKENPLVVVGNWEFQPYEFTNMYGESVGYDIDVLEIILNKLGIPHRYELVDWHKAMDMFANGKADLSLDPFNIFGQEPYHYTRSILAYYKIKIVSRKNSQPITNIDQLKNLKSIVTKSNDDIASEKLIELVPNINLIHASSKDALAGIIEGKYDYFAWGEESLKWTIRTMGATDALTINDFDIPAGELHFVSRDKKLIDLIDDEFARLEQGGNLEEIRNKWFHPELKSDNTSPIVFILIITAIALLLGLYIVNHLIQLRIRQKRNKIADIEKMMKKAILMDGYEVTVFDMRTRTVKNVHGNVVPEDGCTEKEFAQRIHPADRSTIGKAVKEIENGEAATNEYTFRWNRGTIEAPIWMNFHGHSFAEKDNDGNIKYIVNTLKDVSNDIEQEHRDDEMANKYVSMFDNAIIAMSFYDKDGYLIDVNPGMAELSGFTKGSEAEIFFRETCMFDTPLLREDFDPKSRDVFHVCQHMLYPEAGVDKYIEFRVLPVYDGDELLHYTVMARDITAERETYIAQSRQAREMKKASKAIIRYEKELNYLLENSDMWVWQSDLKSSTIKLSRSLSETKYNVGFQEFLSYIADEDKPKALEGLNNFKGVEDINLVLHCRATPFNPNPQWHAVNGTPTYDEDGNLTGHFGIVKDITKLMEAQEKLRKETVRADDSGKLKSVFLANMTHEIRTPLNAIVGFSDLLQVIDTPEDRKEFIRIIRNNCDMLIRLINDIIEASNMNHGPLAIEATDVDFAVAFEDICQTLAQRVQEPGVEFISDNPYVTYETHLDKGRLQQVITNFTTNAVKYTHNGHIKVGYREQQGLRSDNQEQVNGIYMYCEDTGAGIPKEKQASVFERFVKLNDFVQGTGLGLSICKNIADRCGGSIGVESEGEGHGSTFWIWIPCECTKCMKKQ